jgi:16S rRNA (adenine(1408)-N(1))-methyltransferase
VLALDTVETRRCCTAFVATPSDSSVERNSSNSLPPTGEGIVIDLGTGDGRFVYQSARRNPSKFYIGIDANADALRKISEKINRRPERGGLPNVLFVKAAAEALPAELDGIADEVHVHFPWGSLLRGVAGCDPRILTGLRRICTPGALLEVVIGLDPERDRREIARLELPVLEPADVDARLAPCYRAAGFEVVERGRLAPSEWSRLECSWARRLQTSQQRDVLYVIAEAIEPAGDA